MLNLNKLKNIELVLFDVDGTLVNDYGELGERTKKIIMNLKKFGVNFSFASGRLHSALIPLAEELKLYSPLISLDGTVIKSISEKDFVYRSYLKENHVKKAIELSERYMVNIALCHNDVIYYTEQNSVIPKLMDKFGAPYQEVESYDNLTDKTLELVFASDNRLAVSYIRDKFIFPFSLGISISFFRSQTHDNIYYLEIRRSGSSKGKAMKRLLKHLKILPGRSPRWRGILSDPIRWTISSISSPISRSFMATGRLQTITPLSAAWRVSTGSRSWCSAIRRAAIRRKRFIAISACRARKVIARPCD